MRIAGKIGENVDRVLRDLRINKIPIFEKAGFASLLKNGDFIFLQVPKVFVR